MRTPAATILVTALAVSTAWLTNGPRDVQIDDAHSVIVQASSASAAREAALSVGARITHELAIIDSVAATVTDEQRRRLAELGSVASVFDDRAVAIDAKPENTGDSKTAKSSDPALDDGTTSDSSGTGGKGKTAPTHYPTLVHADYLHRNGITGHGVNVAVLDSGYLQVNEILYDTTWRPRVRGYFDARWCRRGSR